MILFKKIKQYFSKMEYKINWKEEAENLTEVLQYESSIKSTEEGVIGEIGFIFGINGFDELWSLELEILYKYISNGFNFEDIKKEDIEELYLTKYNEDIKESIKNGI